jgi:hypothetical protein
MEIILEESCHHKKFHTPLLKGQKIISLYPATPTWDKPLTSRHPTINYLKKCKTDSKNFNQTCKWKSTRKMTPKSDKHLKNYKKVSLTLTWALNITRCLRINWHVFVKLLIIKKIKTHKLTMSFTISLSPTHKFPSLKLWIKMNTTRS